MMGTLTRNSIVASLKRMVFRKVCTEVTGMKKICLWMVMCCLILFCFAPVQVQAEELPVIRITCADDEMLSREYTVEAQITLVQEGMERVVPVGLRLDDEYLDYVERVLPQKP